MAELTDYILGESEEDIVLESSEANQDTCVHMAQQGRHEIALLTYHLDSRIYGNPRFQNAIKKVALSGPHAKIRILIKNPEPMQQHGSPIIELARHLTSFIEIRKINRDYAELVEEFLVVDDRGYLHRKHADRYEGIANFYRPQRARELLDLFNEIWERSHGIAEFKRLYI